MQVKQFSPACPAKFRRKCSCGLLRPPIPGLPARTSEFASNSQIRVARTYNAAVLLAGDYGRLYCICGNSRMPAAACITVPSERSATRACIGERTVRLPDPLIPANRPVPFVSVISPRHIPVMPLHDTSANTTSSGDTMIMQLPETEVLPSAVLMSCTIGHRTRASFISPSAVSTYMMPSMEPRKRSPPVDTGNICPCPCQGTTAEIVWDAANVSADQPHIIDTAAVSTIPVFVFIIVIQLVS